MTRIAAAIPLPAMANKPKADKEQTGFRIDGTIMDRLRAYKERRGDLAPTLTGIVENALRKWLDENDSPEHPKKPK